MRVYSLYCSNYGTVNFQEKDIFKTCILWVFFLTVTLFLPTIPVYNVEQDIAVFDA